MKDVEIKQEEYKLLNGDFINSEELFTKMNDDEFYYGFLGKNALSSSSLKTILKSWDDYLDELRGLSPDIPAQALRDGRLVHLAVLEPHRLDDLTIIDSTKGSNLFKEAVKEKSEAEVYTSRELKKCLGIAINVTSDFDSFLLLHETQKEVSGFMNYRGLPVRGKADSLHVENGMVIDLKTTSDASRFEEAINHWSYDMQGAVYLKMFNCDKFTFIVVDKRTGEVLIRALSPEELKRGQDKLDKAIDIYIENAESLKQFYK